MLGRSEKTGGWQPYCTYAVQTTRIRDSSNPRHFGTSAELSLRHMGTGAEVSRHIGTDVLQILTGDSIIRTVVFPPQKCLCRHIVWANNAFQLTTDNWWVATSHDRILRWWYFPSIWMETENSEIQHLISVHMDWNQVLNFAIFCPYKHSFTRWQHTPTILLCKLVALTSQTKLTLTLTPNPITKLTLEWGTNPTKP